MFLNIGTNPFFLITQVFPAYFPQIETTTHHYTESNHGKDSVDGVGATSKREADEEVIYGTDVPDLEIFLQTLPSKLKNIYSSSVETAEIQEIEDELQKKNQIINLSQEQPKCTNTLGKK